MIVGTAKNYYPEHSFVHFSNPSIFKISVGRAHVEFSVFLGDHFACIEGLAIKQRVARPTLVRFKLQLFLGKSWLLGLHEAVYCRLIGWKSFGEGELAY